MGDVGGCGCIGVWVGVGVNTSVPTVHIALPSFRRVNSFGIIRTVSVCTCVRTYVCLYMPCTSCEFASSTTPTQVVGLGNLGAREPAAHVIFTPTTYQPPPSRVLRFAIAAVIYCLLAAVLVSVCYLQYMLKCHYVCVYVTVCIYVHVQCMYVHVYMYVCVCMYSTSQCMCVC